MTEHTDISFVIPCYRSENTITTVVDEIKTTMLRRPDLTYEIILVNDYSPDAVWSVIQELCSTDAHVVGVSLAKNFGQHCALMAGYHEALGDCIVSLDDDGQTPASEVFSLLDKLNEGYDVVYATYPAQRESLWRRLGSDFAQKMTDYMLDIKEHYPKGSSFFAMKRFVRDEIIRYEHPYPYLAGLVYRTTRNIVMVPLEHRERQSGHSGYTLRSLFALWMNGFTAFSVKPLELGTLLGFLFAMLGFLFALYTIIRKLVNSSIPAGWSSMISIILIIGGIIMILLGLIGEYVGRIYICLNKSPQYVVRDVVRKP